MNWRFLKEKGKLGLGERLVQAQNFLEAQDSAERKWVSANKGKDRGQKYRKSGDDFEIREKTGVSHENGKDYRYHNDKSRFKSNCSFHERRMERGREETPKQASLTIGSVEYKMAKCRRGHRNVKSHTIATMRCVEEDEEKEYREAVI